MGVQADPEGYVRSTDVESTPDADTPRPCGVALLLCLLSRGEGTVASTLIQIASSLQVRPDPSKEPCSAAPSQAPVEGLCLDAGS